MITIVIGTRFTPCLITALVARSYHRRSSFFIIPRKDGLHLQYSKGAQDDRSSRSTRSAPDKFWDFLAEVALESHYSTHERVPTMIIALLVLAVTVHANPPLANLSARAQRHRRVMTNVVPTVSPSQTDPLPTVNPTPSPSTKNLPKMKKRTKNPSKMSKQPKSTKAKKSKQNAPTPSPKICPDEEETVFSCFASLPDKGKSCDACIVGKIPQNYDDCNELQDTLCSALGDCDSVCGQCTADMGDYVICLFQFLSYCDLHKCTNITTVESNLVVATTTTSGLKTGDVVIVVSLCTLWTGFVLVGYYYYSKRETQLVLE